MSSPDDAIEQIRQLAETHEVEEGVTKWDMAKAWGVKADSAQKRLRELCMQGKLRPRRVQRRDSTGILNHAVVYEVVDGD